MPRSLDTISVAIVDDHLLYAEALGIALHREGLGVHQVPPADYDPASGRLLARLLKLRPQVVILGLDLGIGGDGARLVAPLSEAGIAVVVITRILDDARWGECLVHGARTVMPKSDPLCAVLLTIRLAAAGQPVLAREERERLVLVYHREREALHGVRERLQLLTIREQEVLGHLRNGDQVSEIARQACVSEATVRTQVRSILAKLGVSSQLAAVVATHRAHWTPPVPVHR